MTDVLTKRKERDTEDTEGEGPVMTSGDGSDAVTGWQPPEPPQSSIPSREPLP